MKISKEKRDKILEQILAFLYSTSPRLLFTLDIAKEIARDEEFVKSLMIDLRDKKMVVEIKKNPKGIPYSRRTRWKISDLAYEAYKRHQNQ